MFSYLTLRYKRSQKTLSRGQPRPSMQNRLAVPEDKLLTRQRSISETINNQLKTISQILHTRHRSTVNFAVNPIAGLIAYTWQDKKPSL